MQERQLREAAKHNEEAQAVINELRTNLLHLEGRFKQVVHLYTCGGWRRDALLHFKQKIVRSEVGFVPSKTSTHEKTSDTRLSLHQGHRRRSQNVDCTMNLKTRNYTKGTPRTCDSLRSGGFYDH